MSCIPNFFIKKNISATKAQKKKTIPINININLNPRKLIFSNNTNTVNKVTSSYLSIGNQIKINKKNQISKIHGNTNSLSNTIIKSNASKYFLNKSKKINNNSDIRLLNDDSKNFMMNNSQQKNELEKIRKRKIQFNKKIINFKERRQLSTTSNSNISNEVFNSRYKISINDINNSKLKNKLINSNLSNNNITKIKNNYSFRAKYLDSRNRTKKISNKSKFQQFKFSRAISTSFSKSYTNKRKIREFHFNKINNCIRKDLFNKFENKYEKNYSLIHKDKKLYEIKKRFFRHNTTNSNQKNFANIIHKRALSNQNIIHNHNNINSNRTNYIGSINNKNNIQLHNFSNKKIINDEKSSKNKNIINKINYNINSKERIQKANKGKINYISIYLNDNKLKLKENKQNNFHSNNNLNLNNIQFKCMNNHIPGVKKIVVKTKERLPNKVDSEIFTKIPIPKHKIKKDYISYQKNKETKLGKIEHNIKNKKINKILVERKAISRKKELINNNKTDSSIAQLVKNKMFKDKNINQNLYRQEKEENNNNVQKNRDKNISKMENDINNRVEFNYFSNLNSESIKHCEEKNNYIKIKTNEEQTKDPGKLDTNYSLDYNPESLNLDNKISINKINSNDKDIHNNGKINMISSIYDDKNIIKEKEKNINNIDKNYENRKNLKNNKINNILFAEENLDELPEDYDEKFDNLYSIINKINFGRVLIGVEGFFTNEGKSYKKYKDEFDRFYDKLFIKKRNSYPINTNKKKNILEIVGIESNTKTNYSSSKKANVNNF